MLVFDNKAKNLQFVGSPITSKKEGDGGIAANIKFVPGVNKFQKDTPEYVYLNSKVGRAQLKKHPRIKEVQLTLVEDKKPEKFTEIVEDEAIKLVKETYQDTLLKEMLQEEQISEKPRIKVIKAIEAKIKEIDEYNPSNPGA